MLKYNNTHIFTGYLKQLLSSFSLPSCKIYTQEFAEYLEKHGKEDPRVLESFNDFDKEHLAVRINYLKNDMLYHYFWDHSNKESYSWRRSSNLHYDSEKFTPGLTRHLKSPGIVYDTKTHEYLGDYLRFFRDYYNINLMSMYNCFTDKIYNNIYFNFVLNPKAAKDKQIKVLFNAQEPEYRLYALPVKLFSDYTIAIDCDQGIEMFCGLYSANLDMSVEAEDLAARTYQRVYKTLFRQPFLYDKLNAKYWSDKTDFVLDENGNKSIRSNIFTRWDLANREKDLKLFIKVPVSCRSSITILEGDFRSYNDRQYAPTNGTWKYANNHSILNFSTRDCPDLNNCAFKPISQLQLLAYNTGESYPIADRLIEYLSGSAITPIDDIPDNIKRVQKVMNQNGYYFKIDGLWENKMQNILYDYLMSSGPVKVVGKGGDAKPIDCHQGYHERLGHSSKCRLYDVLGYVDKDTENWYASWKAVNNTAVVGERLQSVDIYNGLYDV